MKLSVVIPNYNGKELLKMNLPKVLTSIRDYNEAEIIVVDDASGDGSTQMLGNSFPEVKIVKHYQNTGFSTAVNDGVRKASGDLVLLLNSDVTPDNDFLRFLIPHFMDEDVFAVGCLQYSNEWKGRTAQGRGIGKFEKGFLVHAPGDINKSNTLWVFGGAGLFRKSIWEELGGMDSLYNPFYWEDIDLSYRALKAGYRLAFEPKSIVHHYRQHSSINSNYSPQQVKTTAYRNQFFFVWVNITDPVFLFEHIIFLPYHFVHAIFNADYPFVTGFFKALMRLHLILQKRNRNKRLAKLTDRKVLSNFKI